MEKKEMQAPYCHGMRMVPAYRYKAQNGIIYRTWRCMFTGCGNKIELPLYVEEEE